jgi:hypothetical protein
VGQSPSLRDASDGVIPVTSTSLVRPVRPVTSSTAERDTSSRLARNRTSASLAAPSTGGAVSLSRDGVARDAGHLLAGGAGLNPQAKSHPGRGRGDRLAGSHSRPSTKPLATQSTSQATMGLKSIMPVEGMSRRMGWMIQSLRNTSGRIQGR